MTSRLLKVFARILKLSLVGAILLAGAILIVAAFIKAPNWNTNPAELPEVKAQFKWLEHVVARSCEQEKLDIYTGYYDICGQGLEWDYGFYVFYAMCLDALVQQDPTQLAYAQAQIDACARLMMGFDQDASPQSIADSWSASDAFTASLVTGYQCIVLSIRKALWQDTLYDPAIRGISQALDTEIARQLDGCHGVWSSDQTTHLYAIWRADAVLGTNHQATRERWLKTMQTEFIEAETGLLYSQVSTRPKRIDSPPRATSVAWTIIFLDEIFPEFAAQQYALLEAHRSRRVLSLAAFKEFPGLGVFRLGDLDSGPLILGFSPSATGFSLVAQGRYGTHADYQRSYRIFEMFGRPQSDETGKHYRMGNAMGDAILLYSKIARRPSLR